MSHEDLPKNDNHDMPLEELCHNSIELVEYARSIAEKQINIIQLMTFYSIGRWIVEVQQNGDNRAKYGKQILKKLSSSMAEKFGRGFSQWRNPRQYLGFWKRKNRCALIFTLSDFVPY